MLGFYLDTLCKNVNAWGDQDREPEKVQKFHIRSKKYVWKKKSFPAKVMSKNMRHDG